LNDQLCACGVVPAPSTSVAVSMSSGLCLSLMSRCNSRCAGCPYHDTGIVPCQSMAGQTRRACLTKHLPGAERRPAVGRRARSLCCSLHF